MVETAPLPIALSRSAASAPHRAHPCAFSFDGVAWQEAVGPETGGPAVGPLVCEPGWDFYDVLVQGDANDGSPLVLHLRRAAPIRLVRIYEDWPSTTPPLAALLQGEGVTFASVTIPVAARSLPRVFAAVCPPTAIIKGGMKASISSTAPSSAVLMASAGAASDKKDTPPGGSAGMSGRRNGSGSPTANETWTRSPPRSRVGWAMSSALRRGWTDPEHATITANVDADEIERLRAENARLSNEVDEQRRAKEEACALNNQLQEEGKELQRKLRSAERATMAEEMQVRALTNELAEAKLALQRATSMQRQSRQGMSAKSLAASVSLDEVVAAIVTLELRSLSACPSKERSSIKKKLILKWHPDKNGVSDGGGCGDLATRVTQELQGRPEWEF